MDIPNASNILKSLEILNQTSSYSKLIRNIKQVDQQLTPAFLLPTYKNYNPSYIQSSLLFYTIALTGHSDPLVKEAALHLTNHFSYLMASMTPLEFINSINEMLHTKNIDTKLFVNFLPPIGYALSSLNSEDTIHNFSFIQQLVSIIPETEQINIPITIWKAIGNFAPEDEIMKMLQKNLDIKMAPFHIHLIKKDHRKYSNYLFTNASTDYLNEFFKSCPLGYDLDFNALLNRISDVCQKIGSVGFNSTVLLLSRVIHDKIPSFEEEQETKLKEIVSTLRTFLDDPKILPSDIGVIILVLYESCKKQLYQKEDLKKVIDTITHKNSEVLLPLLKASIYCMEKGADNSNILEFIGSFHPWDKNAYISYLTIMKENYSFIKKIDKNISDAFLFSLFHPLPLDVDIAIALVEILFYIDTADVMNPQIDSQLDYLFQTYFSFENDKLSKLLTLLAKLYRYVPPVHKIDLFCDNPNYWLSTLVNVDFMMLKEILEQKFLKPRHRYAVFEILQSSPQYYTGFIRALLDVIYLIVKVLGISTDVDQTFSDSLTINMQENELLFTLDELQSMMSDIQGPLETSDFGILLNTTMSTIARLTIPEANLSRNFIARAALLAGFLTPLCPKESLHLLTRLERLPQSKNDDGSLEYKLLRKSFDNAFKLIKKTPIPMRNAVDVAIYGKYCLGSYEQSVKEFPDYIKEAISTKRQAADLFKDEINDPLPPMPTFLSFVGVPKHEEWVRICANVISPFDWIIKRSDKQAILACTKDNEKIQKIALEICNSVEYGQKKTNRYNVSFKKLAPTFTFKKNLVIKAGPKVHLKDNLEALPTRNPNETTNDVKTENQEAKDEVLSDENNEEEAQNENSEDDNENVEHHEAAKGKNDANSDETNENDETSDEKGTLYGLISFLWHSTLPLPETIKPADLENYAIKYSNNVKLLIGFFSWANVNQYKIDVERWSNTIKLTSFSDLWLFAISLFASNIHCAFDSLSPKTLLIFQQCLNSFAYMSMTKESLIHAFQTQTGIHWYLIHNILCIDPHYFYEYPAIVAELNQDLDLFKMYLDQLKSEKEINYDAFIAINNIVFKPSSKDMVNSKLIPTNRYFVSEIMSFREMSRIPSQLELPTDLLESVITTLQKVKNVSFCYLEFFMNVKITKEQFNRVYALFFNDRHDNDLTRKFKLPSLFLAGNDGSLPADAIKFYSNKPPSITRSFFRSLLCCFAPPLNQSLIKEMENNLLEPVFPDLCYTGFAKMGIRMWDSATPYSKLRFGFIDSQIGSSLLHDMNIPCREALSIYQSLMALNNDDLAVAQPWATKGMIRDEISRVFLDTATSEFSNANFAIQACRQMVASIGLENVMVLIGNKGFLSKPNFLCAVVVFLEVLSIAKKSDKKDVVDFLSMFLDQETSVIDDEKRAQIFAHLDKDSNISQLLHNQL